MSALSRPIAIRSSSCSNIHHTGKVNIRIDAIERILEGKYAKQAGFPIESFINFQVAPIVDYALLNQRVFKTTRSRDGFLPYFPLRTCYDTSFGPRLAGTRRRSCRSDDKFPVTVTCIPNNRLKIKIYGRQNSASLPSTLNRAFTSSVLLF